MFDKSVLNVTDAELETLASQFSKRFAEGLNNVARKNPPLGYAYSEDMCNAFAFGANCMHDLLAAKICNALEVEEEKPVPDECVKRAAEAENLDNPESNLVFNVTMFRVLRFINRAIFAYINQDDTRLGRYYLKNAAELLENHMIDLDMLDDITVDVPDCQLVRAVKGHIIAAYRLLAIKEKDKATKHLDLVRSLIRKNFKPMELEYR